MHTWTFWAEHWIFKQCRVYYTECSNSSSEYEKSAFLHTHWPTIHSHRGFSQREGGLGIGQNARGEVCVGLKTFENSSVFLKKWICIITLHSDLPQTLHACINPQHGYYAPPFSSTQDDYSMSTPVTKQLRRGHFIHRIICRKLLFWLLATSISDGVFNVSLLCTNVSIPARGPRGPLPPDTKALISQTAEMEFNRIGKTGNVYDHIANIKKSTICESSSSTCSWHAYSH